MKIFQENQLFQKFNDDLYSLLKVQETPNHEAYKTHAKSNGTTLGDFDSSKTFKKIGMQNIQSKSNVLKKLNISDTNNTVVVESTNNDRKLKFSESGGDFGNREKTEADKKIIHGSDSLTKNQNNPNTHNISVKSEEKNKNDSSSEFFNSMAPQNKISYVFNSMDKKDSFTKAEKSTMKIMNQENQEAEKNVKDSTSEVQNQQTLGDFDSRPLEETNIRNKQPKSNILKKLNISHINNSVVVGSNESTDKGNKSKISELKTIDIGQIGKNKKMDADKKSNHDSDSSTKSQNNSNIHNILVTNKSEENNENDSPLEYFYSMVSEVNSSNVLKFDDETENFIKDNKNTLKTRNHDGNQEAESNKGHTTFEVQGQQTLEEFNSSKTLKQIDMQNKQLKSNVLKKLNVSYINNSVVVGNDELKNNGNESKINKAKDMNIGNIQNKAIGEKMKDDKKRNNDSDLSTKNQNDSNTALEFNKSSKPKNENVIAIQDQQMKSNVSKMMNIAHSDKDFVEENTSNRKEFEARSTKIVNVGLKEDREKNGESLIKNRNNAYTHNILLGNESNESDKGDSAEEHFSANNKPENEIVDINKKEEITNGRNVSFKTFDVSENKESERKETGANHQPNTINSLGFENQPKSNNNNIIKITDDGNERQNAKSTQNDIYLNGFNTKKNISLTSHQNEDIKSNVLKRLNISYINQNTLLRSDKGENNRNKDTVAKKSNTAYKEDADKSKTNDESLSDMGLSKKNTNNFNATKGNKETAKGTKPYETVESIMPNFDKRTLKEDSDIRDKEIQYVVSVNSGQDVNKRDKSKYNEANHVKTTNILNKVHSERMENEADDEGNSDHGFLKEIKPVSKKNSVTKLKSDGISDPNETHQNKLKSNQAKVMDIEDNDEMKTDKLPGVRNINDHKNNFMETNNGEIDETNHHNLSENYESQDDIKQVNSDILLKKLEITPNNERDIKGISDTNDIIENKANGLNHIIDNDITDAKNKETTEERLTEVIYYLMNTSKNYLFQNGTVRPVITRNKDMFCTKECAHFKDKV